MESKNKSKKTVFKTMYDSYNSYKNVISTLYVGNVKKIFFIQK